MITNIIFFIFTLFSIISGIRFGYFDSHSPPPQFIISSLVFILGLILLPFKNLFFKKKIYYKIHLTFTAINLIITIVTIFFSFI